MFSLTSSIKVLDIQRLENVRGHVLETLDSLWTSFSLAKNIETWRKSRVTSPSLNLFDTSLVSNNSIRHYCSSYFGSIAHWL
jgi:hypothetical protein